MKPLTRREIRERERATLQRISGAVATAGGDTEEVPPLTRRQLHAARQKKRPNIPLLSKAAIVASLGAISIGVPLSGALKTNSAPTAQALPGVGAPMEAAVEDFSSAVLANQASHNHQAPASIHEDPLAHTRAATMAASRNSQRQLGACEAAVEGASGLRSAVQERSEVKIVKPLVDGTYNHTSPYGMRVHPLFGATSKHEGTDMAAPVGTPIHAVADGVVVHAGNGKDGRSSMLIILEHEINGQKVQTWYVHMYGDGVYVATGEEVKAGQVIGGVGSFGNSTGPHLHFEVHVGEDMHTIEPLGWLQEVGAVDPGSC
ncbi:MAG: M23 family metallopeptidase [Bowdeniella nasicola]|nr:M23 family metallopeptidase [Bowdeniella nasicola]